MFYKLIECAFINYINKFNEHDAKCINIKKQKEYIGIITIKDLIYFNSV